MQTDKSAKSLVYIKEEKGNIKTELVNSKNDSKRLVSLVILEEHCISCLHAVLFYMISYCVIRNLHKFEFLKAYEIY